MHVLDEVGQVIADDDGRYARPPYRAACADPVSPYVLGRPTCGLCQFLQAQERPIELTFEGLEKFSHISEFNPPDIP